MITPITIYLMILELVELASELAFELVVELADELFELELFVFVFFYNKKIFFIKKIVKFTLVIIKKNKCG